MKQSLMVATCLTALLFVCGFGQTMRFAKGTSVSKYLSIIVLGSDQFANASEQCFSLMSRWHEYRILYLSSNLSITPRANMIANKSSLSWALTSWLKNNSNASTQVCLWIFSHGCGLYHHPSSTIAPQEYWELEGGRAEANSDEGPEITEYLIGKDINGDGRISNTTWAGVDEGIILSSSIGTETVWDDELNQWLESVTYRRLIIFMSTCRSPVALENGTACCFGGGFIDDLSAPRRIIITPTNETYPAWVNRTTGIGWFEQPFMDALTPGTQAWNEACDLVSEESNACPGVTSFLEAFIYARLSDKARIAVRNPSGNPYEDPWRRIYPGSFEIDESPWLDDGGNFKPTFANGTDVDDLAKIIGWDAGDEQLAMYTWLLPSRYQNSILADVNTDWKVDTIDLSKTSSLCGRAYWIPGFAYKWSSLASLVDVNQDNRVDIQDVARIAAKYGWHYP
jgi:hypothetical protein